MKPKPKQKKNISRLTFINTEADKYQAKIFRPLY